MAWADLETICTTAKLKSDRSRASGGYLLDVCNLPMEDGKLSSTSFLPLLHNKGSIMRIDIIEESAQLLGSSSADSGCSLSKRRREGG